MVKLVENSFRDVNIAFANEISVLCDHLAIDPWEVIGLANHHPRVEILQPGPGVGGHCIAVDPWFIVAQDPETAHLTRTARQVNDAKTDWVIAQIRETASDLETTLGRSVRVACLGLAYKADVDDLRESPALRVALSLANDGIEVLACEPHIPDHPLLALVDRRGSGRGGSGGRPGQALAVRQRVVWRQAGARLLRADRRAAGGIGHGGVMTDAAPTPAKRPRGKPSPQAGQRAAVIIGTRPEAIKLAPVVRELRDRGIDTTVIGTGQHRDLVDSVLGLFGIALDHDLQLMQPESGLNSVLSRAIERIGALLELLQPDVVVVQGDTTSALGGALAAFNSGFRWPMSRPASARTT